MVGIWFIPRKCLPRPESCRAGRARRLLVLAANRPPYMCHSGRGRLVIMGGQARLSQKSTGASDGATLGSVRLVISLTPTLSQRERGNYRRDAGATGDSCPRGRGWRCVRCSAGILPVLLSLWERIAVRSVKLGTNVNRATIPVLVQSCRRAVPAGYWIWRPIGRPTGAWRLLFLQNPEAVASGPPSAARLAGADES